MQRLNYGNNYLITGHLKGIEMSLSVKDLEGLRDWMAKNIALVNAEIKVQEVVKMQKVHRKTGSKDDYGLGFYNGIEFAVSIMKNGNGIEPKFLSLEEYK